MNVNPSFSNKRYVSKNCMGTFTDAMKDREKRDNKILKLMSVSFNQQFDLDVECFLKWVIIF